MSTSFATSFGWPQRPYVLNSLDAFAHFCLPFLGDLSGLASHLPCRLQWEILSLAQDENHWCCNQPRKRISVAKILLKQLRAG